MHINDADPELVQLYEETNDGESFTEWFAAGECGFDWDDPDDDEVAIAAASGDWEVDDDELEDGW